MELDALRVLVKVAELQSFTHAAEHLGMSKSRASVRVQELETALGTRLLQRTTRTVRLTPDGERLLGPARQLLADADELGNLFLGARGLRGLVRVDLPATIARDLIIPSLPDLLARHPLLELQVSTTDRRVDVVREGFELFGQDLELKLEGRNLLRRGYREFQERDGNRVFYNRYDIGTNFSISVSAKF